MYGWTDPMDPDPSPRREDTPTGEPAWLTDRPEPRSSYLFGDESEEPTRYERPAATAGTTGRLPVVPAGDPAEPVVERAAPHPAPQDRTTDRPPVRGEGRHRPPRRLPRPVLIGGTAAAATLAVSLGVGALLLPGDDTPAAFTGATDEPSAVAPLVDETLDAAAPSSTPSASPTPSTSPSPTASPSPSRATPSPSRTTSSPTPDPQRNTSAPSRRIERSSSPTQAAPQVAGTTGSQAQQVVNIVNAERAKAGCGAVQIDDKLTTAAQRHSQDQADTQNMSHTGSDGSNVGERLDRVGYVWRTYGENVAWNQRTPEAVMDAWMNSPGHRANILNCAFTEIGVGIATGNGPYWTQKFAAPR
ncbi:CAP domain-containing protein [Micromonospora sp. NPDC000207]|uniref:CAP domain-containing protein n=1 Tax=Micromonospora sp. NPDC000207 TaxID=3154246 RepID=UPI0033272B26